jgi:ppGpp synthetase/RelA/SpoT-type nucleotidyltranferase
MKSIYQTIIELTEQDMSDEIATGYDNINKREIDLLDTQMKNIEEKIQLLQKQKQEIQKQKQDLINKK